MEKEGGTHPDGNKKRWKVDTVLNKGGREDENVRRHGASERKSHREEILKGYKGGGHALRGHHTRKKEKTGGGRREGPFPPARFEGDKGGEVKGEEKVSRSEGDKEGAANELTEEQKTTSRKEKE